MKTIAGPLKKLPCQKAIVKVLSSHKDDLYAYGVRSIRLSKNKPFSSPYEILLTAIIERPSENSFSNFMSLVSYLERILSYQVTLYIEYPKRQQKS